MNAEQLQAINRHNDELSIWLSSYEYDCGSYEKDDDPAEGAEGMAEAVRIVLEDIPALLEEVTRLRALHEPRPDTYACAKCGRRDGLDCVIPNQLWNQIEAETGYGVLCAWCLDAELVKRGIQTRGLLSFNGNAISGGTDPVENNDAHWEMHLENLNTRLYEAEREVERLRALLSETIERGPDYGLINTQGVFVCEYCGNTTGHKPDCPINRARAALGDEVPE